MLPLLFLSQNSQCELFFSSFLDRKPKCWNSWNDEMEINECGAKYVCQMKYSKFNFKCIHSITFQDI